MKNSNGENSPPETTTANFKYRLNSKTEIRIALAIGNSRLHWGLFLGQTVQETWDTQHLSIDAVSQLSENERIEFLVQSAIAPIEKKYAQKLLSLSTNPELASRRAQQFVLLPLILASVVPDQTALWQGYPDVRVITLDQLPMEGLYATLGIDRALTLLGAGLQLGWPVLVVDAGTALTFTGADVNRRLVGGAILPGLGLQLSSLGEKTAGLPIVTLPYNLPQRWVKDTETAITSGVVHGAVSAVNDFIQDWLRLFPNSKIAITGGDRTLLLKYLASTFPDTAAAIIEAPEAIFWGMSRF
ncbi:pantothenate kinase [Tychonema sp. BBK16]|uniref:pantothenate kinase n=1 Tax=Tychonema sp. BBK16 TaxID=2699888 RepID=UPI001F2E7361|nr:pantothenate kinase [Tychonema sp. BBK16]MCF6371697.1 pantothenate kinase [Tychonema sp. BBK16]